MSTETVAPPPVITAINTPVRVLFPPRYTFNRSTGIYSGYLTILNVGVQDYSGPISVVFLQTPKGVHFTNTLTSVGGSGCAPGDGIFGGPIEPSGLQFINTTGDLIRGVPLRVLIQFTNPGHINLSTFYHGPGISFEFFQGQLEGA